MTRRAGSNPPRCQIGTVAQLRRVDPAHAGRIVLVENPATPVTAPGARASMPAWRIYVLGRDLRFAGADHCTLVAAEPCLQPLCVLDQHNARALGRNKALWDADAAIEQLRRALEEHPMDHSQLNIKLKIGAIEALALQAVRPVLLPLER